MAQKTNSVRQYAVLGMLFVIAAGVQGRLSWDFLSAMFAPRSSGDRFVLIAEGTNAVALVWPAGEQAGLRAGDRIVSVNDRPYTGEGVLAEEVYNTVPDSSLKVNAERGGEVQTFMVIVPPHSKYPVFGIAVLLIFRLVNPLFCLGLGFFVAFQRPFDRLAWLLLFLVLGFSQVSVGTSMIWHAYAWTDPMRPLAILYYGFCLVSWPIWMMLFGTYFPERSRIDRQMPWLKFVLTAPVTLWGINQIVEHLLTVVDWPAAVPFARVDGWLGKFVFVFFAVPISAFFFQLGVKSGTLPSADARRRLRLMWIGTSISLTPAFVGQLFATIRNINFDSLPEWFVILAITLQFLFPLTLAYVIVVQRAMDVRMAVRQGLQYTLARGGILILRMAVVAALIGFTIYEARSISLNRLQIALVISAGIALVLLLRKAGEHASQWLDRRFFREAYNSEQILADLSENVRTIVETMPLLETVAMRLSESLHVTKIAMLLRVGGGYQPAYALGYDEPHTVTFGENSSIVNRLRGEHEPLSVFFDDPDSWTQALNPEESAKLAALGAEMILPLSVKDKLHGFISLGEKQSEEPYSRTDVRLLRSVATQTGLALENSHLTEVIATEVAQRERLNRELEIAREVQQRLFPQKTPSVPGLEYAGHCRPAEGVGGDYYDFIAVPDGHFGIAIGDISGKGIPAALLMASLQASLRGQAISSPQDLAGLMTNLNRLIFDASASNRYATFFYGQYDSATRVFEYVNGGHNPPMVLRGSEVIRMEEGGPVVGLFAVACYSQGSLQLQPGDLVVAFTDGISEAMNSEDEEFGEERMIPIALDNRALPAQSILDRLFAAADEFAAGAPQHDDMTAVIVKVS